MSNLVSCISNGSSKNDQDYIDLKVEYKQVVTLDLPLVYHTGPSWPDRQIQSMSVVSECEWSGVGKLIDDRQLLIL